MFHRIQDFQSYITRSSLPDDFTAKSKNITSGEQGTIYKCMSKSDPNKIVIKKVNKGIDNSIINERSVMQYLQSHNIRTWNPHMIAYCDSSTNKDVLHIEHIQYAMSICKYIENLEKTSVKTLYSLILQTLIAIKMYQEVFGMIHNDLHTHNVMVGFCPDTYVFRYVFAEETYEIPTYGVFPIIIDYGLTVLPTNYLYPSMSFTNLGHTCVLDKSFDPRVFLCNVRVDLLSKHNRDEKLDTFIQYVETIYRHFDVDTGRIIDYDGCSLENMVSYPIQDEAYRLGRMAKSILYHHPDKCVWILQSMIRLPLRDRGKVHVLDCIQSLSKDLLLLENLFLSKESKMRMLRIVVDTARTTHEHHPTITPETINAFRTSTIDALMQEFSSLLIPPSLNFSHLYLHLREMAEIIETVYFRSLKETKTRDSSLSTKISFLQQLFNLKLPSKREVKTWNIPSKL